MGDQPGAGGSRSYKIRGHSRQRRSTKPYSRPTDSKKGVLETVKDFFSPSWLVDFWRGKITSEEEEEIEQDEDIGEPEYTTDRIEPQQGSSKGSTELVNTRLTEQTSLDTRETSSKVYGNGGLGSVASARIPSRTSRKSGLSAFLSLTKRHTSEKESVVTRTVESTSSSTESLRPVDQERVKAQTSTDHNDSKEGESPSSSHVFPTRTATTIKDSESPSISFLNPGPSRKVLTSLISTSTPMPGPSTATATPMAQMSTVLERIPPSTGSRPQPASVFRSRPEFSVAAFGSPLPPNTQNKRLSPFYSGKTAFGGASSQFTRSAKRVRVSSPGIQETSRPIKKQIKPTPIAGPGVGGVASQTAKRILETLEKMSSPLVDAKKIPPSPPFSASSSPLSFTQSTRRKHPYHPNRAVGSPRKLQAQFGAPPVQPLSVPQRASISRIHQKTQSTRTSTITLQAQEPTSIGQVSTREISKPTPTFTPTPLPISLSPKEPSKGGGKMKTTKSNTHYKSQTIPEDQEEVVNPLPEIVSAVPLNIPSASFPTFSLSPSSTSTKTAASTSSTSKMGFSFATPKSKPSDITTNNFKFSIPEPKASSSLTSSAHQSPEKKSLYSFSRPAPVNKSDSSTSDDDKSNKTNSLSKYKPAEGLWECTTCMVNNKAIATTCVACSASKPTKTVTLPSNDLLKKFAAPAGSWSYETCLISNKSADDKCVACPTPKPSSSKTAPVVSKSEDLRKKFAPVEDSWECSTCMLNNKGSDNKCVACQTPKPSSTKPASRTVGQSEDLRKKFAPTEDSWECSTCMLNNKGGDAKCVACDTPNPSSSQKSSLPTSSTSDDLVKKFAPSSDSWECSTCMIDNKGGDIKCVACQTPKPGTESSSSSSSSKFTFGAATSSLASKFAPASGSWTCDTCMIVNKSDALKCLACETPKPGSSTSGGFSLATGSAATKSSFTFGAASTESNTKTTFQFGSASTKSNSSSSLVPFQFVSNAVTTTSQPFTFGAPSELKKSESSDISSFVFGKSASTTSETKTSDSSSSAPKFTFGASATTATASKPTVQPVEPAAKSGSNATPGNSQPKIQFGGPATTEEKKALPFTFGGSKSTVQFGSSSLGQESVSKASETPAKRKHTSIAEAAAAGLLKIPSSSPTPAVVDLTGDDSNTTEDIGKGSAPPKVNLFQLGTQPNQKFPIATAAPVTTKSETTASTALPSLPFAFGAMPASKPVDEVPKGVPPFSFLSGASAAASTAAAPSATASSFNFASPLGSNTKALGDPTVSSLVTPQMGPFPATAAPVSTTVTGFPSVLNTATTTAGASVPFTFKATTNTNGKFGSTPSAPGGFSFGTSLSNASSGSTNSSGGFAFGGTSAVPSATNTSSTPFVFGAQNTSEPKPSGFNFTAASQPFGFAAGAAAAQNNPPNTIQQVSEESMDADGNNNSSQPAVPAFGSPAAPSATPFTFNTAPSTNSGFNFGNAQTPSAFKFGATQATPLVGSTPVGASAASFGSPAPTLPAGSGGFTFGATNNIGSAQPSGFAAGSGGGSAFTAGAGGVQTKRIIKKGVRRMKR